MDWFRFYTGTLNSAKVQELPDKLFKAWVNFMCVARLFDGVLPGHTEIAFRLRISPERALKLTHELKKVGLIDEVCDQFQASELRKSGRKDVSGDHFFVMHDWDEWQKSSDDSAPRKRKQRVCLQMSRDMSQDGHALEQSRTEQIQNRTEQTTAAQPSKVVSISEEFPKSSEFIKRKFPTTDDAMVRSIVDRAVQEVIGAGEAPELVTDEVLLEALMQCTSKKQYSAALYLNTVGTWMRNMASTE